MTLAIHTIATLPEHFDSFDLAETSIDNFQSTFIRLNIYLNEANSMHISFDFRTSTFIENSAKK